MGGIGSGQYWRWNSNDTTDDYRCIDVRRFARDGLLDAGLSFRWYWTIDDETVGSITVHSEPSSLRLMYSCSSYGQEKEQLDYKVFLDTTHCHFGGHRVWFRCPARGCGRRVAKLYGGRIFACRHCYNLAYPSQREAHHERFSRKAERIRSKLGWEPGTANGHGPKPKRMHWRTFRRLCAEHDRYDRLSWQGFFSRFGHVVDF